MDQKIGLDLRMSHQVDQIAIHEYGEGRQHDDNPGCNSGSRFSLKRSSEHTHQTHSHWQQRQTTQYAWIQPDWQGKEIAAR